jgi:hypothetical protein
LDLLTGTHYVVPTPRAKIRAWKLVKERASDYWRIRNWSLELAHYPHTEAWAPIRGLEDFRIGRLKVTEEIAGQRNLRIVFWKANAVLPDDPRTAAGEIMPRIWILDVYPKKSFEYTTPEKIRFRLLRANVLSEFYAGVHEP